MKFSEKIKLLRERTRRTKFNYACLTQEQFGKKLGINKTTICFWEIGICKPSKKSIIKILKFCNECNIKVTHKQLMDDNFVVEDLVPKLSRRGQKIKVRVKEDYNKTSITISRLQWEIGRFINNDGMFLYQYELANMVGCHRTSVSNYYCKRRVPNMYFRRKFIDLAFKYKIEIGNTDFITDQPIQQIAI